MTIEQQKYAVAETVARIFHALDDHDWDTIGALTADPVDIDYPSKQGGVETLRTGDFLAGLRGFLPGFDATQHLLGPIVVTMDSPVTATSRFHARVTHLLTDAADERIWVIGCHYTVGLARTDNAWKLTSSRVRVSYEEGSRELETRARRRVSG
ncbi:nuclear transport factor 2 family protein [Nocardia puris]|uniref:SnoaL-like protein n=1 Tax=Nocardia puris TaxID=208602 RepID=A0A366DWL8_9NOCA|nr:nuclear transport factor 2 family protein [Nocardia puris]MBF6210503.1 nuclear transport factor 2 family protein [Nocardia puris]MBF6369228.1 nuclear transport factor 2 family protein [Nocardia puris]MBF6457763.1 nuclear transport factor 2 family protein [Nocardia puris]RBO93929.1 SnoaL-like protein [Nocardia puris]